MKIVIQIKFLVVNKLKAKKSTKTSNYKTFITFKKSLIQKKIKTAFAGLIAVSWNLINCPPSLKKKQ